MEERESGVRIGEGGEEGREAKVGVGGEEGREGVFPVGVGMARVEDLGDGDGERAGVAGGGGLGRGVEARFYAREEMLRHQTWKKNWKREWERS